MSSRPRVEGHLGWRSLKMSDREFDLFQKLIDRETGIFLPPAKRALLVARLAGRLRELGLPTFGDYYRFILDSKNEPEWIRMVDCISTHETRFFREPRQLNFLETQILPLWKQQATQRSRSRQIRVWSAGCSSGEEPYSLAMILRSHLPAAEGWRLEIVATDLSSRSLELAKQGVWPVERSKEIPTQFLKAFMLKGVGPQAGKMTAGREIRSLVRFELLNLNTESISLGGAFDMILCRNVLIYFHHKSKRRIVHRLIDHLSPRGYLLLGHAETLNGLTDRMRAVVPSVYTIDPLACSESIPRRSPGGAPS